MRINQQKPTLRRGSAYISVAGVAMLVSMISLSAMHLTRLELRAAVSRSDVIYAQRLAQSSVEFALGRIDLNANWRTDYTHGTVVSATPSGRTETLRFRLLDNLDSDLADNANDPVEIQGIGSWGDAVHVCSVRFARGQGDPLIARAHDTVGAGLSEDGVKKGTWYSQYLVPNQLPADAIEWTLTSVELLIAVDGQPNGTLNVSLHHPNDSLQPGTLIEMLAVSENNLPSARGNWHEFVFTQAIDLDPTQGLCLTLTTSDGTPAAAIDYQSGGVAEPGSHLTTGSHSGWDSANLADSSLYYRVHGTCKTASGESGEFQIEPGSWKRVAAP